MNERQPSIIRSEFARTTIVSNCHLRIAFAPNQVETAELLSEMTGTATVHKASFNFSGSWFSPVQRCQHLRLALEPRDVIRVIGERRRQNLDCNIAAELRIVRAIHRAHAALAKLTHN